MGGRLLTRGSEATSPTDGVVQRFDLFQCHLSDGDDTYCFSVDWSTELELQSSRLAQPLNLLHLS